MFWSNLYAFREADTDDCQIYAEYSRERQLLENERPAVATPRDKPEGDKVRGYARRFENA